MRGVAEVTIVGPNGQPLNGSNGKIETVDPFDALSHACVKLGRAKSMDESRAILTAILQLIGTIKQAFKETAQQSAQLLAVIQQETGGKLIQYRAEVDPDTKAIEFVDNNGRVLSVIDHQQRLLLLTPAHVPPFSILLHRKDGSVDRKLVPDMNAEGGEDGKNDRG
jgi:hypothetical protein